MYRGMDDGFDHDRYYILQRIRPMVNQYEVSRLHPSGGPGQSVAFVQQKRMALKEDLRAYSDDTKTREVFRIKAQQRFDPRATYDVTDGDGVLIGRLRKEFGASLLRSRWRLYDPHGQEVAWAQESSLGKALWRRFIGLVPFVGGILDMIPVRYHFGFHQGEAVIGQLRRELSLRDRYVLDLSGDAARSLDRRLALALAVGMDALQAR